LRSRTPGPPWLRASGDRTNWVRFVIRAPDYGSFLRKIRRIYASNSLWKKGLIGLAGLEPLVLTQGAFDCCRDLVPMPIELTKSHKVEVASGCIRVFNLPTWKR
jgi:hypothetical protein